MSEDKSSKTYPIESAHEVSTDEKSKTLILTQEGVDEQIKIYTPSVTTQLDDLTPLLHGSSTAHPLKLSPRASNSGSYSAVFPMPEMVTGGTRLSPDNHVF